MLTDQQWFSFATGGLPGTIEVCTLPLYVKRHLKTFAYHVKIKDGYAKKIRFKHKVKPEHFHILVPTILFGVALSDGKKMVAFHYRHEELNCSFEAIVKLLHHRDEAWVSTFHRISADEIRRKQKRFILLQR